MILSLKKRPPDSQDPTTISPPSAILYKDSSTLSVGVTVHCAADLSCRYLFIRLFCFFYARFCRLSCEIRRDLADADLTSHTSHTQPFLDPACAVISFRL